MTNPFVDVQPLPDQLPATLHGLRELRASVATRQTTVLSELRIRQQLLHSKLRACRAAVHARLDLEAVEALLDADAHAQAWQLYQDQLALLGAAVDTAATREQTGRLDGIGGPVGGWH